MNIYLLTPIILTFILLATISGNLIGSVIYTILIFFTLKIFFKKTDSNEEEG